MYQTSPWLEKADEKGELFIFEVEKTSKDLDFESLIDNWGDNQSLNSRFPCSNSEDTGYSSDAEVQPSLKSEKSPKKASKFSQFLKRKEVKLFDEKNIEDSIDTLSGCDCVECRVDTMTTSVKDVLLIVDPESKRSTSVQRGVDNNTSLCEHILGIIPGCQGQQLGYNGVQEPIYVKGLSPDGPAIKVKDIQIGNYSLSNVRILCSVH